MLHTKLRGNQATGSGEKDGYLGHVTQMPRANFCHHYPWRLHKKFGFDGPSGFREKDVEHCYIYSIVSLSQWSAVPEIKYKEEQEEKLICIKFRSRWPQDKNRV